MTAADYLHPETWARGTTGEREASDYGRPRLLTPEEYARDLAPEALIEGLVYRHSTTLATGISKGGKTWWALQAALCAHHGVPFLGLDAHRARVLYVSLELAAGMVRERIEALCRSLNLPAPEIGEGFALVAPTADHVPRLDLGAEDCMGWAHLRDLLAESGAQLVVLDTLYRFLPGLDPNDNREMGHFFGNVNALAQETGAAALILDHVAKGESTGPVSHSALGASVKGGAARVVANLKRTTKDDGGRWELGVESHFGSWEAPIHYERPTLPDGTRGYGCVPCTATEAWGLSEETIRDLFRRFGERSESGFAVFTSGRKLRDALQRAGHASSDGTAHEMVRAILRDQTRPESATWGDDRPIETSEGPRQAHVFRWRERLP